MRFEDFPEKVRETFGPLRLEGVNVWRVGSSLRVRALCSTLDRSGLVYLVTIDGGALPADKRPTMLEGAAITAFMTVMDSVLSVADRDVQRFNDGRSK
jgi:hypothetical protein